MPASDKNCSSQQTDFTYMDSLQIKQFLSHPKAIFAATDEMLSFIDCNYIYRSVNPAYCRHFDLKSSQIENFSVIDLHGSDAFYSVIKCSLDISLKRGLPSTAEFCRLNPKGQSIWLYGILNPYFDNQGKVIGVVVAARDITEYKRKLIAMNANQERLQEVYDHTPSMFFTVNKLFFITSANAYANNKLKYAENQLIGLEATKLFHPEDQQTLFNQLQQCFETPDLLRSWELRKLDSSGQVIWVKETARVVERNGEQLLFIVSEDISEKHELAQKLAYQASHDYLTGLYNRQKFEQMLNHFLLEQRTNATAQQHILCFLDLDQFKIVNDSCGHAAGDILLKNVSEIIQMKVRSSDVLARLGGDEFAIIMQSCELKQALLIADDIRKVIADYKFNWNNKIYSIGVSMGVVEITGQVSSVSRVMALADEACYAAKDRGRNRIHVHRETDCEIKRRRRDIDWVNRIKNALEQDHFHLYAQKIAPTSSDPLQKPSFEILLRMHDQEEVIFPDVFLPAAERYNLTTQIDRWVLRNALLWLSKQTALIENTNYCTINLSATSLGDRQFLKDALALYKNTDLKGLTVCFEITETAASANFAGAVTFIEQMKALGCVFALDNFGGSVSTFSYLKNLPVDMIKIDGSYIRDIDSDKVNRAMVKSINDIALVMGKKTIAENVESQAVLDQLTEIGVDYVQGYFLGKPMPIQFLA